MPHTAPSAIRGLYVITDPQLSRNHRLITDVESALKGGAKIVQFRDKTATFAMQLQLAHQLKTLCESYQACFIINDNIQLAQQVQAHGIHIGQNDCDISTAREILGDKAIIGVSCYNDLERAHAMQTLGADYVAFGRFFPSNTKPTAPQAELETLKHARELLTIPTVAIGGITHKNAHSLIHAGADSLAVIHDVFSHPDIESATRRISEQFTL